MRGSRFAVLCAVAGLLLLAVVVARGSSAVPSAPRDVDVEWEPPPLTHAGSQANEPAGDSARNDMAEFTDEPDRIRTGVLVVVLVLVLVAVSLVVLRTLRRRRRRVWVGIPGADEVEAAMPARLRRAAEHARTTLAARTGGPPDDAVVAAWLTLEEAAEAEGAGRLPHETPTEFTVTLLGRYTTDEPALDELRALYQRARFGPPGDVGEVDVQRATDLLDRVLRAFGETATA